MPPGPANVRSYRLILADHREDILEETARLLTPDFDVAAAVKDGHALVEAARTLRPDAVVCDIHIPGLNGIECGARLIREGLCRAVIVLSMYNDARLVAKALAQGIQAYILKEDASSDLAPAVHAVMSGGTYLSRGVERIA